VKTNLQAKHIVSQAKIAKCDGHHVLAISCFVTRTFPRSYPQRRSVKTVTGYGSPLSLAPGSCRYHAFDRIVAQSYRVRFASHGEPQVPPGARSVVYYNPTRTSGRTRFFSFRLRPPTWVAFSWMALCGDGCAWSKLSLVFHETWRLFASITMTKIDLQLMCAL
jgi:hypothetical protein